MGEVCDQASTEHPLRPEGEELLERDEDQEEHGDPDDRAATDQDSDEEPDKAGQPGDESDPGGAVRIRGLVHGRLATRMLAHRSVPV
jgi:hypothetical protein